MNRATIDYGIDLGTTNSSVAVLDGTEPDVIPNKNGASFTPSAVYIDKRGQLHVGQEAKQRVYSDQGNAKAEFKLQMGKGKRFKFEQSNREMSPEELSAEVLKSLKADVQQNKGENIQSVVITVPAAFEVDQCDATRKAAELAGFTQGPLLQEPVAAALAYGFQDVSDNVFWMTYDFGGGTFDAAVIQVRDGIIQVVNHAGDNYLGGQRIDWDIVEKRLIPKLTEKYKLSDFRRGNSKWLGAIAKLKGAAEEAKIEVCRKKEPVTIWIEDLCEDENGQSVDFEYELTPDEVKEIISSYVTRSINLCKQAIEESGLKGHNIEKILMVGGTTLIPWLRERVQNELEIKLEFSIDPITAVARGAAIFAGTQKQKGIEVEISEGSFKIELEYEPMGSDTEPTVGGRIIHPDGASVEGYTIEFVENKSQWRSGKTNLTKDGVFETEVHADKGRKCEFIIELCDTSGTQLKTVPERFNYTVGMVITNPPITHNLGVAMANNQPDFFFEKGTPLPARMRKIHHTAFAVRKGQKGDLIRIPVIEGKNKRRADRNDLLGCLEIQSDYLKRDIPAGSDVEITIYMDESRILTTKAYIPILDEEFEKVINFEKEKENIRELKDSFENEKKRLGEARKKAISTNSLKAQEALAKIESENMLENVKSLSEASEGDDGAVPEFQNQLTDLKTAIDAVEDALEWPSFLAEIEEKVKGTKQIVNQYGDASEKAKFSGLEGDVQKAIDSGDSDVLRRYIEELQTFGFQVLSRQDVFWVGLFQNLVQQKSSMKDTHQAEQLIAQGRSALNRNDIEGLKAVVRQLIGLLPVDKQQQAMRGYGSTIVH